MTVQTISNAGNLPFDLQSFQTAYDHNPQAFCIVHVQRDGDKYSDITFVYANQAYSRMSGYALDRLIGYSYVKLMGSDGEARNELYAETAYGGEAHSRIVAGKEPDTYVSIQCFQIAPGYCGSNVLDVTTEILATKKAQAESAANWNRISEERSMYQTLLNQSSAMITVIDAQTYRILYANAATAEVTKQFAGGYVGSVCYQSIAHGDAPCKNCILLRSDHPAEATREIHYGGRTYQMVYKRIEWNGRTALMEYSEDITEQKRATQLAEENALLHKNIITNIPTGVIVYKIVNHNYQIIQVNPAICRTLGLNPSVATGAVGDTILSIVVPEDREIVRKAAIQMAVPGVDVHYEFRGKIKGKSHPIWLGADGRSAVQPDGSILVYICYHDITERKEKELEFQQKMEFIANLDNDHLISKGRHNLTKNIVLDVVTKTGGAITGEYGQKYDSLLQLLVETAVADKKKAELRQLLDRKRLLKAFTKGEREFSIDYRRCMENHRQIWATLRGSLYEEPGTHDIIAFLYSYDSTEQIQEAQIVARIGMLEYALIGLIDPLSGQYKTFYVDEADSATYRDGCGNYEETIARRIAMPGIQNSPEKLLHDMALETVLLQLEIRSVYEVEYSIQDDGKAPRRMRFHFSYLDDSRDTIIFFRSDITENYERERTQMREIENALAQTQEANRAKSMFFSRMSHDMRTPMNGILGVAMLSEQEPDNTVLRENMKKIKESGQYLLSLINDTLDMQRIESGRLTLDPQIVSTADVVENILDMIRSTAQAKGVQLKYSPGNTDLDWYIRVDALRLKQIFINLLSNAVKFTSKGGTVNLEFKLLSREGMISHDVVYIRDTGVGMSQDFLQHGLFQPFSQENNQMTAQYAGSGLGLSIAKSLTEMMGGRIEVESELGEGTTFSVYLDFERVDPDTARKHLSARHQKSDNVIGHLQGKRILLVEDHQLNAEIATKLLQRAGCTVKWANNGQIAIDVFRKAPENGYDVILMDIRMPVMDGLTATKAIRALDRPDAGRIPIIAMTANAYEDDVKQALAAGMNAHIAKPVEPATMYQTIAQTISENSAQ